MKLTSHLPPAERDRVEGRLHSNLIAWLTTVRPDGQPVTVPVWFLLRDDETILLYSRPEKDKLRNIAANPKVSFALDVTDIGRNIVRLEGTARRAHDQPPANEHPAYLAKYTERLGHCSAPPNSSPRSSRPRSSSRRPNCIPEGPGAGLPSSTASPCRSGGAARPPPRCRRPPYGRVGAEADDLRARIHTARARPDRLYPAGGTQGPRRG